MLKMTINGAILIKSLNNKDKIDCNTVWNECPYFFEGECHNKNVESLDDIILCPYYLNRIERKNKK